VIAIHLLRSIVFTLVFYAGCVVLVPGALIAGLVSRAGLFAGAKLWAGWFVWCSRWICGVRLQVEGTIPPGPHLFALKHESAYETFLTLWLFTRPAVVMKAELRDIPVWGVTSARHGSIFVDREGSATMLRAMMKAARAAVDDGRPVLIFPEGTRVAVGTSPPLASGFAGLYKILKLTVVPVAVDSGKAWPKSFIKQPGVVRFRLMPPIEPGLPREVIEARVHAAINSLQAPAHH
jgi:1-acyl-sn-glycerol-3-phosphate acyltransferase